MTKGTMKTTSYLLITLLALLMSACNIINPDESLPGYIHIDEFEFESAQGFGSASENITEIWAYSNDQLLGAYDLPADIPVIDLGTTNILLRAGIKNNGISATRIQYPFYTDYRQDVSLEAFETDTIRPYFTYKEISPMAFADDFDSGTLFVMEASSQGEFEVTNDTENVFEGNGSGRGVIDEGEDIFRIKSFDQNIWFPDFSQTFLEMDYKCNNTFAVGVYSYLSNGEEGKHLALIINPTNRDGGEPQWNKIYVDFSEIIASTPNAVHYEMYIESKKDDGVDVAELYFDNIKMLHF